MAKEMKQGVTIIMCIYYNQCYKFPFIENKNILLQYSMQQQSAGLVQSVTKMVTGCLKRLKIGIFVV